MRLSRVALVLPLALLAGCGSTVQTRSTSTGYDGELGTDGLAPTTVATQGTTGGATQPGTAVGTTGGTTALPGNGAPTATAGLPAVPVPGAADGARLPLSIGVVLTGTSNADQFGVSLGNTLSEKDVDQAVIDGINKEGGIAGRKVVPVYASTDTGSANWETDFAAACATFTQDHHVVAVLGYVFNYFPSFEGCLAQRGVVHLNTGFNIPDRTELSRYPLFLAVDTPTIDRRGMLKLDGGVATGVLTKASKLGILTDTCPGTERSLAATFLPTAKRLGVTVAKTVTINCANGNADSGAAVGSIQNAVLQFVAAGVDRVVIHGVSEGPPLLLFALAADSQGYRPTYLVTSLANLDTLKGFLPASQKANIHGYGWMANQDVPPAAYPKPNASQKRCLGYLAAKGLKPTAGPDFAYAYNFCEAVFTYQRAVERTGGLSAGAKVMTAIQAFGANVESVINNEGSAFGPRLDDAVRATRHAVYTSSCGCWAYTGAARTIPTD
jgi:ABC-type branched-subunit amino acid transport system substrate-binding protein